MTDPSPTPDGGPDEAKRRLNVLLRFQSLAMVADPLDREEVAQIQREMNELLPEDSPFRDS